MLWRLDYQCLCCPYSCFRFSMPNRPRIGLSTTYYRSGHYWGHIGFGMNTYIHKSAIIFLSFEEQKEPYKREVNSPVTRTSAYEIHHYRTLVIMGYTIWLDYYIENPPLVMYDPYNNPLNVEPCHLILKKPRCTFERSTITNYPPLVGFIRGAYFGRAGLRGYIQFNKYTQGGYDDGEPK